MTPSEAATVLRKHNEWRRFGDDPDDDPDQAPEMLSPKLVGEAIDVAVEYIGSREYTKP